MERPLESGPPTLEEGERQKMSVNNTELTCKCSRRELVQIREKHQL